jgi:predicted MFS family arabinose efflux permease
VKKSVRVTILKYGISTVIAVLLIWAYLAERDLAGAAQKEQYKMLCDAFFIPGMLFLMVACLVWASSKGAMDGLAFLGSNLLRALVPGGRLRTPQKYYDYIQERQARRKTVSSFLFLFVVGGVCMAVAVVFVFLYYR